jgi:hypothetical protein
MKHKKTARIFKQKETKVTKQEANNKRPAGRAALLSRRGKESLQHRHGRAGFFVAKPSLRFGVRCWMSLSVVLLRIPPFLFVFICVHLRSSAVKFFFVP